MKHITRYTDRTIRTDTSWVKITRDNKERTFTFAKGDKGNTTAHHVDNLSFKWCANWTEATERANRLMAEHATTKPSKAQETIITVSCLAVFALWGVLLALGV